MDSAKAPDLTDINVDKIIETARDAENLRDIDALQENLQRLCADIENPPDFADYDLVTRAELLRMCGSFLTFYARSKNKDQLQLRAKDLLTAAEILFERAELPEKISECRVALGWCYWNAGEVREYELIYAMLDDEYASRKYHPVSLILKLNKLTIAVTNGDYERAIQLFAESEEILSRSPNVRLKAMFHGEAAIAHRRLRQFKEAIYHFQEALLIATKIGSARFEALNYNNFSLLYADMRRFDLAHFYAGKALEIYRRLNDDGWIPHVLDTMAAIHLAEQKFLPALDRIEEALTYFRRGEDARGLTESLFTKNIVLLKLRRQADALCEFAELYRAAGASGGERVARQYADRLAEEFYAYHHLPMKLEEAEFRKSYVSAALAAENGEIVKSAARLGLKYQTLSNIIRNQHPELSGVDKINRRRTRSDKNTSRTKSEPKIITISGDSIRTARSRTRVSKLILQNKDLMFDFDSPDTVETFFFGEELMRGMGFEGDAIVAVVAATVYEQGSNVLVSHEGKFFVGEIRYDQFDKVFYIEDETGFPLPLDLCNVIGEPLGFCPLERAEEKIIEFRRLV